MSRVQVKYILAFVVLWSINFRKFSICQPYVTAMAPCQIFNTRHQQFAKNWHMIICSSTFSSHKQSRCYLESLLFFLVWRQLATNLDMACRHHCCVVHLDELSRHWRTTVLTDRQQRHHHDGWVILCCLTVTTPSRCPVDWSSNSVMQWRTQSVHCRPHHFFHRCWQ